MFSQGTAQAITATTLGRSVLPRFPPREQAKIIACLMVERDNGKRVDFDAVDLDGAMTWANTHLGRVFWSRAHSIYRENKVDGQIYEVIG